MNGFRYLALSALILFLAVFGLTRCGIEDTGGGKKTAADTPPSQDTSQGLIISDDEYTLSGTGTSVSSASVDPAEADNTWAMFLVNAANPLPANYDNYVELDLVDTTYREYYLDRRCAKYMKDMLAAAASDGIELITSSAYRSVDYQKSNFENSVTYRMEQGMSEEEAYEDTVRSVQLPGQSEHNAGLAVDILSNEYTSMEDDGFENTKAFEWLSKHASEYGFILRYPRDKTDITGIIYEPWHYRFVGKYYAKDIEASGLTLEEYFDSKGWTDENGMAVKNTVYDRNPGLPRLEETAASVSDTGGGADTAAEDSGNAEDTEETVRSAVPQVPEFTDDEFEEVLNDDSIEEIVEYEDG